jgi:CRISPR-associated Csx2 family protein
MEKKPWKLITFIGMGYYQPTNYKIKGVEYPDTKYFPLAAAKWLIEQRGDQGKIVVLVTKEVIEDTKNQNLQGFKEALLLDPQFKHLNVQQEIFPWKEESELWEIFKIIVNSVENGETVYFDITHSFRFIPSIVLLALIYLKEVKRIDLQSVFYGNFEATKSGFDYAPVFDILPFVDLAEWLFGARVFKEFGLGSILGDKIKTVQAEIRRKSKEGPEKLIKLGTRLNNLSSALAVGNAIGVGENALKLTNFINQNKDKIETEVREYVPPLVPLIEGIVDEYAQFGLEDIQLNMKELEREESLIRWYLEKKDIGKALQLFREFIVNTVLYINAGSTREWLKLDNRLPVERQLHNLKVVNTEVGRLWGEIAFERNLIAHCGFNNQDKFNPNKEYRNLQLVTRPDHNLEEWISRIASEVQALAFDEGSVLLTPLGLSKGLLFTLWQRYPDIERTIILTSAETVNSIEEVKKITGYSGEIKICLVQDPFTAFDQIENKWKEIKDFLKSNIIVNITGGTTALQYLVEKIQQRLINQDVRITTVAAIDRRPVQEQKENPWVAGQIIKLKEDHQED